MGHSLLKHSGKCGGNLYPDITRMFSVRTPSVSITAEGIFVGVVELQMANNKNSALELGCEKCGENLDKSEFTEKVGITCMVCRKTKKAGEVFTCVQVSAICAECADFLSTENKETLPDYIKPLSSVLRITKEINLVSYADILQQTIRI